MKDIFVLMASTDHLNLNYINKCVYIYNVFNIRLLNSQGSAAVPSVVYLDLDLDQYILAHQVYVITFFFLLEAFM